MERASLHLMHHVILFTTSSSVRNVSSIFTRCVQVFLWFWSTHNKVNERLSIEEAYLGSGDPKFLKTIWPPKQLCPSCYLGHDHRNNKIEWNQDEVYKFLTTYYGKMLASLYKDKKIVGNDGTDGSVEELRSANLPFIN